MSRLSTPRRSTRSQSIDSEGLLSEEDRGIASSSALSEPKKVKRKTKVTSRISTRPKSKEEPTIQEEEVEENGVTSPISPSRSKPQKQGLLKIDHQPKQAFGGGIDEEFNIIKKSNKARTAILKILSKVTPLITLLSPIFLFAAIILVILLPTPEKPFRRNVYVDENALQPGSTSVEWGWGDVDFADRTSNRIRDIQFKDSEERAELIANILQEIGLVPYKQRYRFTTPSSTISGVNTYARWPSARGDGREAFIIAIPWKSSWNGEDDPDDSSGPAKEGTLKEGSLSAYDRKTKRRTNVRGIATALTIARFLIGFKHWSKDLLFVIADDELHGMQAWTSQYFGRNQKNLDCDDIRTRGALVWNALGIDYPSDSFSHIILQHEGLDGQLPNMDVISTLTNVMYRVDNLPVELPDSMGSDWPDRALGDFGDLLEKHVFQSGQGVRKYLSGLKNMIGQIGRLTMGRPNGVHGLFHRYHVDAITIFAKPSKGPYGFWQMGRVVESVTRSMSNLLERLHHSHFFYILTSADRFIEVAKYLPVAILFSAALLIAGIGIWVEEGNEGVKRQDGVISIIQLAISEESELTGTINGDSQSTQGSNKDIQLKHATIAQRTASLVSSLVQRAARQGDLIGGPKIRMMSVLLDTFGRPAGSALMINLFSHAIGAVVLLGFVSSPVDCAREGLENCKPLQIISFGMPLSLLVSCIFIAKSVKKIFFTRLEDSQNVLPQESIRSIYQKGQFGVYSVARVALSMAMMEAGVVIIVISIVNFSLAAVLGGVMAYTLYITSKVGSKRPEMISNTKEQSIKSERGKRNGTPASDDSEEVDLSVVVEKKPSMKSLRFKMIIQSIVLISFTPTYTLLSFKGLQIILNQFLSIAWLKDLTLTDRIFDNALWDYHILSSTFLPVITMTYLPILLTSISSCLLIALH